MIRSAADGYWLELTRAERITMAWTAIGSVLGQVALLFATPSRASMTMLPLIAGLALTLFMLAGAVLESANLL